MSIVVLGGILVVSAVITNLFARKMYNRCAACGTLNARRRTNCRSCDRKISNEFS